MKLKKTLLSAAMAALCCLAVALSPALAQKPIVLGAPLAMSFLYGWDVGQGL